jgi:hypothetical protein
VAVVTVAIVEGVDEVEGDVARNQIKPRRTPARMFSGFFFGFFCLGQKICPFYRLPII